MIIDEYIDIHNGIRIKKSILKPKLKLTLINSSSIPFFNSAISNPKCFLINSLSSCSPGVSVVKTHFRWDGVLGECG